MVIVHILVTQYLWGFHSSAIHAVVQASYPLLVARLTHGSDQHLVPSPVQSCKKSTCLPVNVRLHL